jgi:hypothetical protein
MGTELAVSLVAFAPVSKHCLEMFDKMQFRNFRPDLERPIA